MAVTIQHKAVHWTGVAAGPVAWATSTEFNYATAAWQCAHSINLTLPVGTVLSLVAVAGALISAWLLRAESGSGHLLAGIGAGLNVLSAVIVLTQGLASVVVNACVR
jgi:hypothetical protein